MTAGVSSLAVARAQRLAADVVRAIRWKPGQPASGLVVVVGDVRHDVGRALAKRIGPRVCVPMRNGPKRVVITLIGLEELESFMRGVVRDDLIAEHVAFASLHLGADLQGAVPIVAVVGTNELVAIGLSARRGVAVS